jgi:hypothetical protein
MSEGVGGPERATRPRADRPGGEAGLDQYWSALTTSPPRRLPSAQ